MAAPAPWITSNWSDTDAKDEDHYPPLLYAAMQECGYMKRAMYHFRTHKKNGEMRVCEIKVLMPGCESHPQMEPWTVHVIGSEFSDTVQMAAYHALCELVERREKEIGQTSIKYVPTLDLSRALYKGRMEALEGSSQVKDGSTVVLARYAKAASNLLQLSDNKEKLLRQRLAKEEEKSERLLGDLKSETMRNVLLEVQLEQAEASEWALKNSVDQLKESVTALNEQVTELTTQHAVALAHAQKADETQREALAWSSDQLTKIRAHCNRYHMTARQWETIQNHVGELNVVHPGPCRSAHKSARTRRLVGKKIAPPSAARDKALILGAPILSIEANALEALGRLHLPVMSDATNHPEEMVSMANQENNADEAAMDQD